MPQYHNAYTLPRPPTHHPEAEQRALIILFVACERFSTGNMFGLDSINATKCACRIFMGICQVQKLFVAVL